MDKNLHKKEQSGFTLVEVIMYVGLFSLLIGSAFITSYQLIQNSSRMNANNTIQEEGNFVVRKINSALTGAKTTTITTSSDLQITKYDGTKIHLCLNSGKVKIHEGVFGSCSNASYLPITTDNVFVSSLNFIATSGAGTEGVTATITFTKDGKDFPFSITKYIRK